MRNADVGRTGVQLIESECAGRDRYDLGADFFSSVNVRWRVSDKAGPRLRPKCLSNVIHCVLKDAGTSFTAVAKKSKTKKLKKNEQSFSILMEEKKRRQ